MRRVLRSAILPMQGRARPLPAHSVISPIVVPGPKRAFRGAYSAVKAPLRLCPLLALSGRCSDAEHVRFWG